MEPLSLAVLAALIVLLAVVIGFWRSAVAAAQARERELLGTLAFAQQQAALGEEARRSLTTAQAEGGAALAKAAAADSRAAVAVAEGEVLRSRVQEEVARLQGVVRELGTVREDRDTAANALAAVREQVAQLESAKASARQASEAREAAQAAQSAAESAKATAEAEALAAKAQGTQLQARITALEADIAKREVSVGALAQKLADSEASRGAAQSTLDATLIALTEQKERLDHACTERDNLRAVWMEAQTSIERLRGDLSQAQAVADQRELAQEEARAQLPTQLRALTQQLYAEQGKAMLGEGRQQLEQTLTPFRERLLELQTKIDQVHAVDLQDRASLQTELKNMLTAQTRLSAEAEQLGRALRADSKAQGTWGELTLQRLLESSQLERGLTYELQVSVRSDDGVTGRPDAILFLPEQKVLAIDAKVSLTAFIRATNALDEATRALSLQEHLQSVRNHMRGLAARDYPEAIKESLKGHSLDLTLLFLPSDAAYAAAMVQDSELWAEALRLRIIIVSPTTLLATLRVVGHIWRVEKQNRNAEAIAKEAGGMLEKLRGSLEDFDVVEQSIQKAHDTFAKARGKLVSGKGNVIRRAEKILSLGASAKDATRERISSEGEDEQEGVPEIPAPDAPSHEVDT